MCCPIKTFALQNKYETHHAKTPSFYPVTGLRVHTPLLSLKRIGRLFRKAEQTVCPSPIEMAARRVRFVALDRLQGALGPHFAASL
jgi:hypothetical protein